MKFPGWGHSMHARTAAKKSVDARVAEMYILDYWEVDVADGGDDLALMR